jgi:hypothetical protein
LQSLSVAEKLEARIHARTAGRLRFLRVRSVADRICVWGAAPTYHVRQLAEQAALSFMPADRLQLEIEVLPAHPLPSPEFRTAGTPGATRS